jgi:hypothetical protein
MATMTKAIEIYLPDSCVSYEEGIDGCTNINVHFYFANVVMVVISFSDGSHQTYYQTPVILYETPVI